MNSGKIALMPAMLVVVTAAFAGAAENLGLGAPPPEGADILLDGTRATLDANWTYWEGPRFASSLPIKWKMVDDPVDSGKALLTDIGKSRCLSVNGRFFLP